MNIKEAIVKKRGLVEKKIEKITNAVNHLAVFLQNEDVGVFVDEKLARNLEAAKDSIQKIVDSRKLLS